MRRSRSIAAAFTAVALAGGGAALLIVAYGAPNLAEADPSALDPNTDEIIATAPEAFADLAAQAPLPPEADHGAALTAAVRGTTTPAAQEWTRASADALSAWAAPTLVEAEKVAVRYEPRVVAAFSAASEEGEGAALRLDLGGPRKKKTLRSAALQHLGVDGTPRRELSGKGRWFAFAATGSDAVGMNLARDRDGELKRAGWSAEKVAAVGDNQVGFGWRRGALQASVGLVEREISAFGHSIDERFVAFTLSIRAQGARLSRTMDPRVRYGEAYVNQPRRR